MKKSGSSCCCLLLYFAVLEDPCYCGQIFCRCHWKLKLPVILEVMTFLVLLKFRTFYILPLLSQLAFFHISFVLVYYLIIVLV